MSVGLSALFWGVITLSILVLVHEGGHFFAARAFGVRVREFMVGLPGPKLSWKRGDTLYGVTAIPLGGYVKVVGMEGDQHNPLVSPILAYITAKQSVSLSDLARHFNIDEADVVAVIMALKDLQAITEEDNDIFQARFPAEAAEDPDALLVEAQKDSYLTIPTWKRISILLAGVACNLFVAILVFTVILSGWESYQDKGYVNPVPDAPAMSAGIPQEARILSINGVKVSNFNGLTKQIQAHEIGDEVTLVYDANGTESTARAVLGTHPDTGKPYLGISPHPIYGRLSVGEAIKTSFLYVRLTVEGIAGFFNPGNFSETMENSASVIGISVIAAEAVKAGPIDYAFLIAAISLSLGLMNLLPIPPLDGGKIILEIIEKIIRRPLPMKANIAVSAIGFLLLFSLMAYLMYNDISRLIAG